MPREIIVTNKPGFLKRYLLNAEREVCYLIIEEDNKSNLFRRYLLSLPNTVEVAAADMIAEGEFVRQYSAFIYNLNARNASRIWWAANFTNKNPLLTSLCKNIYDFFTVKRLIETKPDVDIVVVLSNPQLARFIKGWAAANKIPARVKVSFSPDLKLLLSSIPAFFLLLTFMKLVLRTTISKLTFRYPQLEAKENYIIITQFEKKSFKEDGSFYDAYFGRLREILSKNGTRCITNGFLGCALKDILRKIKYPQSNNVFILEYFLSGISLCRCLKESICAYFKKGAISGDTNFDGQDVLELVKNEFNHAFNSGQVLINLSVYYSVRDFLKKVQTNRIIYPFENRSWEKMILLAARELKSDIKLTGYQHASLTPKHINFIMEKGEIANLPFPDEIITMGKITKNLLEDIFAFPANFVQLGCALRQERILSCEKTKKTGLGKITLFVPLASSLDEYARILKFLDKASLGGSYAVKIRPHPAIEFNAVFNIYRPGAFKFQLENNRDILESFNDSDIILYASSTVSIEALFFGKPVVYIDFGNFISPDPLFNFSEFKWTCRKPKDLSRIIGEIKSLDKDIFEERQKKGILYARDYFYPVNSESIKPFLKK